MSALCPFGAKRCAEQNQFFAALTCEELDIGWGMKSIINLTFNLDRFTLIEDTSNLEKVGLTHQLNIRGAIPASELEDREWLIEDGKKLLDSGKCMQIFNEKFHKKILKNEEKYDIIILVLVIIPFLKERALNQNYEEKQLRK